MQENETSNEENFTINSMCGSRKYPTHPKACHLEISRRRGVAKANIFKGKFDAKREFPEGWGGDQGKKPSVGGVWIFSGTLRQFK